MLCLFNYLRSYSTQSFQVRCNLPLMLDRRGRCTDGLLEGGAISASGCC